jgi:hypothetical protein
MKRAALAQIWPGALVAIALFSFFVFPRHTYLQQDTQIYVPILERQWSGALAGDPVAEQQHVRFTLYDELTNTLRWVTRLPLRNVLEGEQIVFRALGLWGVFLIATGLGLDKASALVVVAIAAMGADIPGPAVLAVEYEPTPRAFSVPLVLLSVGFVVQSRYWIAGLAGAAAVLLHAPTTWPLWVALAVAGFVNRRILVAFVPMIAATLALLTVASLEGGAGQQHLFARLTPSQEYLERMRTAYDFVSTWWQSQLLRYVLLVVAALLAVWRLQARREISAILAAFLLIGLVSLPLSAAFLEGAKLAIVPQIQPARALLFLVVISSIVAACAGFVELRREHWFQAMSWFIFCSALPLTNPKPATVETPDLQTLTQWAHSHPGVYAFPEAGHSHAPGWFRAIALQPVYVDWKEGGQVNYLPAFGDEWWQRWQATMHGLLLPERYSALGISYVALPRAAWPARTPVYHNDSWTLYSVQSP